MKTTKKIFFKENIKDKKIKLNLKLIFLIFLILFFSKEVLAVHVNFKTTWMNAGADLEAKWGIYFTDQDDNLLKDGSQLCVGDKVFVRKKAVVNWFFTGGQFQCPEGYFITSSEMSKLYCLGQQQQTKCPDAKCRPILHQYVVDCPWSVLNQQEPLAGDVWWDFLEDAKYGGTIGAMYDYSCLNLKLLNHVIEASTTYAGSYKKQIINIVCNGTTSSGEDVASISKEPIDTGIEFLKEGDYILDASTYTSINDNATIYCILWHALAAGSTNNKCLRTAQAGIPQNYFPVTLQPEYSSITIHVIDPDLKLELSDLKLEKDNDGNAILSFKLKNVGKNNAKVKDLFVLDKEEKKFDYDVLLGDFEIDKEEQEEFVLKMKNKFCELADKDLFLSIKYSGNPDIYCHGKPYFGTIKEKINLQDYPAYDIKVGVVNSTILIGNLSVGDSIIFESNELVNQINEFLKNCNSAECIVPINISISNEASLLIHNLKISYSECLLVKEIVAHMLACWERASYGKSKKDFLCYQLAVPRECSDYDLKADDIAEIMINNDLCDVLGFSKMGCGLKDQVDFELKGLMKEGSNILIEYKDGKIVVS
ncbi:MAG: hypothetical protein QXU20_01745 [Candidatus Woesearchaeota archaeon]